MRPIRGNNADLTSSADLTITPKKFSGYLRKKRNKVGGWSKLWFVLHDRLLVSYKSKEDYYNKLVSFKDVLNLMPGTQIRPLEGFNFRFTIETTSQNIYTFHCDDRDSYREWISKLLDCLATTRLPPACPLRRLCPHFSVDDLTYAHARITANAIIGAEPNVSSRKSNVEKILERNVDCLNEHSLKRQAVRKHIDRMNITAEDEFRSERHSNCKGQQRHSKLIARQSKEEKLISYQDEGDMATATLGNKDNHNKPKNQDPEPVYAVVDLRNKYVQRKKRLMEMQGKRWNSYESIFPTVVEQREPHIDQAVEAIYEDGDAYFFEQVERDKATFQFPSKSEEENIYEPINVGVPTTAALTLRKYISRLTISPFLRLHKANKSENKETRMSGSFDVSSSTQKSSKFSTVRSRFGVHRKSMQRRIRRFYGSNFEPNPLFQYHGEKTPIVLSSDKIIGNIIPATKKLELSGENHSNGQHTESFCETPNEKTKVFDSLPHFKRAVARISLFNSTPFKSLGHKDNEVRKTTQIVKNQCNISSKY